MSRISLRDCIFSTMHKPPGATKVSMRESLNSWFADMVAGTSSPKVKQLCLDGEVS